MYPFTREWLGVREGLFQKAQQDPSRMKNLLAKTVYYTRPLENGWAAKMNELVREKIDSGQVSIYQNVSRLGKQTQTQVFDIIF